MLLLFKVSEVIESHKAELVEKRYKFNLGLLMSMIYFMITKLDNKFLF